jgi:RNA polymerase sigma-70 factor, ECF subfamily
VSNPSPVGEPAFPERDIIARIHAGDQRAFEVLFKEHYSALVTFVDGYVGRDAAEELVQEVFLAIWRRHETWKPTGSVRAYLFTAARNQALSILRKQRVAQRAADESAVDESVLGAASAPTPAQEYSDDEIRAACHQAIHKLPESSRVAVMLRWDYGMSLAEIGFILGMPIRTVEVELNRGVKALSKTLAWIRG